MQPNPIYDTSDDTPEHNKKDDSSSPVLLTSDNPRYASTEGLLGSPGKSVADNPHYGTNVGVAYYEMIDKIPARKQEKTQGKQGNNQVYYNVVAKRDDTVIYSNAEIH